MAYNSQYTGAQVDTAVGRALSPRTDTIYPSASSTDQSLVSASALAKSLSALPSSSPSRPMYMHTMQLTNINDSNIIGNIRIITNFQDDMTGWSYQDIDDLTQTRFIIVYSAEGYITNNGSLAYRIHAPARGSFPFPPSVTYPNGELLAFVTSSNANYLTKTALEVTTLDTSWEVYDDQVESV